MTAQWSGEVEMFSLEAWRPANVPAQSDPI
jgi:hypothetical protein